MQERTPLGGDETREPRTCMNKRGLGTTVRETGRDGTGIMYITMGSRGREGYRVRNKDGAAGGSLPRAGNWE